MGVTAIDRGFDETVVHRTPTGSFSKPVTHEPRVAEGHAGPASNPSPSGDANESDRWLSALLVEPEAIEPGTRVRHRSFGCGNVLKVEPLRGRWRLTVEFESGDELVVGLDDLELEIGSTR